MSEQRLKSRRFSPLIFAAVLALFFGVSGCSGKNALPIFAQEQPASVYATPSPLVANDPAGPVRSPVLPPELAAAQGSAGSGGFSATPVQEAGQKQAVPANNAAVPYEINCESPEAPELVGAFAAVSLLYKLQNSPPQSLTGLEQRLRASLQEGKDVLHSYGYYAGSVRGWVEEPLTGSGPVLAHVLFTPGPQYKMGVSKVVIAGMPDAPAPAKPDALERPEAGLEDEALRARVDARLPRSLENVGLAQGAPAVTDAVLNAVDRVPEFLHNNGYPFAEVTGTRYVVDHEARLLEAEVRVEPGDFVRMGALRVEGAPIVTRNYLEAKQTWKHGQAWNEERVEAYRESLRQSGLFKTIEVTPASLGQGAALPGQNAAAKQAEPQVDGLTGQMPGVASGQTAERPVVVRLEGLAERTVGGALKYNSDLGIGVQGYWEHRNFTGRGDKLRIEAPLWADLQELSADYRLPFFLRRDQDFTAHAALLNQDTDAYELSAGQAYVGLDRRFTQNWFGGVKVSVEGGEIKEPLETRRSYAMLGLPLSLGYSNTNNPLDSTRGVRGVLSSGPYVGTYGDPFAIVRNRFDGYAFFPLRAEDKLVLALRGALGAVWGESAPNIPTTVRFYSGGGGSVRGYDYQSIGPRNEDGDPLGGSEFFEVGAEARIKFSQTWGMAAFVDGGSVGDRSGSGLMDNTQWGAGLGLRYYTAIGPVRFDVATPLNPRSDDPALQIYISIGQSF